jgi:hypothetical protein
MFQKYRLLIETALIMAAIVVGKFAVELAGLEFISPSLLYTSIIAGGVFILSVILSGLISDFKESEKLPMEIATAAENIYDDALAIELVHPDFDLERLRLLLIDALENTVIQVATGNAEQALKSINALAQSFVEMEKLGVIANYIVRLRQEQSAMKKAVLRIHHIQRVQFLPSAHLFAQTTVYLIVGLLLFTRLEPQRDGLILIAFVTYLFVFLIKLIRLIETPFEAGQRSSDEISLVLLRETIQRLKAKRRDEARVGSAAAQLKVVD